MSSVTTSGAKDELPGSDVNKIGEYELTFTEKNVLHDIESE